MKPETLIYDKVRPIIPLGSDKTVFFASITQTSYEVFFYAFIDGTPVQCYELAEEGKLDENELDSVFVVIVDIVKESKLFHSDKNNIVTITVDKSGAKMNVEYYEKDARMYKIKKEWEQNIFK
jgi:hypothetical protein